jgi:hypothetical protein
MHILTLCLLMQTSLVRAPIVQVPMLGDLTDTSVKILVNTTGLQPATVTYKNLDALPIETKSMVLTATNGTPSTIAQFNNLTPNTSYQYSIDGTHKNAWHFKTRPANDTATRLVNIDQIRASAKTNKAFTQSSKADQSKFFYLMRAGLQERKLASTTFQRSLASNNGHGLKNP